MAIKLYALFLLLASSFHDCDGEPRENISFASYYGDHMVLQKSPEKAVLWGRGPERERVTVSLSGPTQQKTYTVTVMKGIWRVTFDPVEAGGPYSVTAAGQNSTATLTDVLFGDVWLCGGQSNMGFPISALLDSLKELGNAKQYPHVRPFTVATIRAYNELQDLKEVELPWSVPTPRNLFGFSAVCWLFGRYMYDTLKYPIGLVESCWSGSPIEAWSSPKALTRCGLEQSGAANHFENNSVMWNSMIHPLLNMTLKGAIWYQGEANAEYHQDKYNCSFPTLIDDWRQAFHLGSGGQTALDFPFGFVQLSTYQKGSTTDGFPEIRWHQTDDVGFVPNPLMRRTFMAVTMDLPDATSRYGAIHPEDKEDVAYRLTLGARAVAYNEKGVAYLGPFPSQIMSSQKYVNITYDQAISVTPSKNIFEICCSGIWAPCGPKSHWVPAPILHWGPTTVQLDASLCLPPDEVAALRYAWSDWPCDFKDCPIYSARHLRDLPAPPFIINRCTVKKIIWKKALNHEL